MELRPSRQTMMASLADAGIEFPETASIGQLRVLHDAMYNTKQNKSESDEIAVRDYSVVDMDNVAAAEDKTDAEDGDVGWETAAGALVQIKTAESSANTTTAVLVPPNMPEAYETTAAVNTYAREDGTDVGTDGIDAGDNAEEHPMVTSAVNIRVGNSDFSQKFSGNKYAEDQRVTTKPSENAALEEELNNLKMKMEILQLQRQINLLEASSNRSTQRMDMAELDAAVPPFSGDDHYDVEKWFVQYEDYVDSCGYTDKDKCVGVRRRLEGSAQRYANNLGVLKYRDLKTKIVKLFKRTVSRQDVYRQLRSRTLRANESCISYLITMQSIATQTDIDERELIDFIIDGIPDATNAIACLYGAETIDDLVKRLDRYEHRRQEVRMNAVKSAKTVAENKAKAGETVDATKKPIAETRCFNCSKYGHFQSQCPKPKGPPNSCFICAETGHYHQSCPKKNSVAAVLVEDKEDDRVDTYQMLY
ncbi:uncharacterized protein LOC135950716 [Calliphora vicina]|uniref:uncharacterized protein LOC135950716 n=1 Tax=Calliphora vicina TaxID=7373 RepID=UPI00325ACD9E